MIGYSSKLQLNEQVQVIAKYNGNSYTSHLGLYENINLYSKITKNYTQSVHSQLVIPFTVTTTPKGFPS